MVSPLSIKIPTLKIRIYVEVPGRPEGISSLQFLPASLCIARLLRPCSSHLETLF